MNCRLACLSMLLAFGVVQTQAVTIANLSCEDRTNPLGIDVAQPRLGWTLQSSLRGDTQTAYQVLAASSQSLLNANTGDLWNSGMVLTNQLNQTPYGGAPLSTSQQIFWKVRVWDANSNASAWSASATWTMGVLNSNDWAGQWIMGAPRKSLGFHAQTSTSQSVTKWVQVDLGQAYPIASVKLHPKWHQGLPGYGFPLRFHVEISNDPAFASSNLVVNQTTDLANPGYFPQSYAAPNLSARYVRVTATKLYYYAANNNYTFALGQLEVLSGGANVALNASVSALDSVEQYGWGAVGLTDGAGFVGCDYGRRLRREFLVQPGLRRAVVHVSGLGAYELSVNGVKNGSDLLAPGWTYWGPTSWQVGRNETVLYDTRDITSQLQPGTNNAIGIILGNSFYNITAGYGRYVKFTQSFGPLRAIVQVRLDYTNGATQFVYSDTNWQTGPGAITFENPYAGEDYDARLEPAGWNQPGFTNAEWTAAVLTNGPGGTLQGLSCAAPPLGKFDVFIPIRTSVISARTNVYDLGQNATLMPQLQISGPAGSYVQIVPSELLGANGLADRTTCTQDSTPPLPSYWQYTLKGSGTETWTPQFYIHGTRYLQVQFYPAPGGSTLPTIQSLQGVAVHSSSTPIGSFTCSNPLFNQIYSLVRWAQMNNMVSVLTDCPHRERLGWLEQGHLNGPSLRYNFDLAPLFTKIANDIFDSQWTNNGFVPNIAPEYFQTSDSLTDAYHNSPEWGSTFILGAWQQYQFSGDSGLLQRFYPAMKAYLNYLTSTVNGNYVVATDLGDWYDMGQLTAGVFSGTSLTSKTLPGTAIYYADAVAVAQMAQLLGYSADAATYTQLAANIRAGFNAAYFNAGNGTYDTSSQTANGMPLALGLVNATNVARVTAALINDIQAHTNALTSGEVGIGFVFRALEQAGRADLICAMLNQTNFPGYGYQLAHNCTSLTERWDDANTSFSSQDHFMCGQVMEWFYHGLVGIQPDAAGPGFKKILISPGIGSGLAAASAVYNSANGLVTNQWTVTGTQAAMTMALPPASTALVCLPLTSTNAAVYESGTLIWTNGAPANSSPNVTFAGISTTNSQTSLLWAVGSGTYQFAWTIFPTPTGLTATPGNHQVNLAWNSVAGAVSYNIKRASVSGGPYTTIASGVIGTNYTDTAVTNGGTYYYVVCAGTVSAEGGNSFEASASPQFVFNFGFETPKASTFLYNPAGGSWTFSAQSGNNGSGVTPNGTLFNSSNPNAPQGTQVAFLQSTGAISQAISGFVPGAIYAVIFAGAQRAGQYQHGGQTWNLKVDNAVIASYSPPASATNYVDYTANFTATAATHTVSFVGTDLVGGDNTVFLDNVRIAPAPTVSAVQLGMQLTNPPAGSQIQISWPADHTGWRLQMQTNGLGTNWVSVLNANYVNTFSLPTAAANAFFRLVYP
ncbi:MAG TPA: family 78 glycoside hydrolase catalytic domain [Verrucomicrobiae bacterium]